MKVEIKVFVDGEEWELKDLPNEYLAGLEQECKRLRISNDRLDKVFKRMVDKEDK